MTATFRYKFDGRDVSEEEWTRLHEERKARLALPTWRKPYYRLSKADTGSFVGERDPKTGRQGRYMGQYARYKGDPKAVFLDVRDAKAEAKRRGWSYED